MGWNTVERLGFIARVYRYQRLKASSATAISTALCVYAQAGVQHVSLHILIFLNFTIDESGAHGSENEHGGVLP